MVYSSATHHLFQIESQHNGAAPGVVRRNGRAVTPADSIRVRNRAIRDRTEDEWVRLIGEIEEEALREAEAAGDRQRRTEIENLRLAIAKKIYWDIFTVRRWRGLDDVVHEPGTRIVRYFCRHTAPDIADIRVALWRIGYPVSLIRVFYPGDTTFTFFRVQTRPASDV